MSSVELVGILNVTPDSFSDGGDYFDPAMAIQHADELFSDGASYVDVGAESTRPGAEKLTADEEWRRLEPVWSELVKRHGGKLSLDTYHPETVQRAAEYGDFIVNDVTGFYNPIMIDTVAKLGLRCIVSHLPSSARGDTESAHRGELLTSIDDVRTELLEKREELERAGISKEKIILDPGIGFGKLPETNWGLLAFGELIPDSDVMIGYSRKRFLGENRMDLEPNLKAARIAILAGARYLRVHDVAGHQKFLESVTWQENTPIFR